MTKQEILNEVIDIIFKVNRKLNSDFVKITEQTKIKLLGLNSLSYIKMIVLIENKFHIEIYDYVLRSNDKDCLTVGSLCDNILSLL